MSEYYPAQEMRQIQIIEQFFNLTFIIYSKEYKSPTGWISQIDLNLWLGCIRSKNMLAKRKISLWTWGWCILMRGRQRGKRPGWRQRRTCRTTPRRKYPGKMRWNASYKGADALRNAECQKCKGENIPYLKTRSLIVDFVDKFHDDLAAVALRNRVGMGHAMAAPARRHLCALRLQKFIRYVLHYQAGKCITF